MNTHKVKWTYDDGKWTSIKETTSDTESQDTDSEDTEDTESQHKDSEETYLDPEDKQIYEGNLENVPTIIQSEIRIFLSSTFKGNIIIYNI
jgi:hypothetical protein